MAWLKHMQVKVGLCVGEQPDGGQCAGDYPGVVSAVEAEKSLMSRTSLSRQFQSEPKKAVSRRADMSATR
jgi:hypothetical protein